MSNLYVASLEAYEKQTDIALFNHPLAEQLQNSDSAESVSAILQGQVPICSEFGVTDRITKSLRTVVSVLYALPVGFDIYLAR